MTKLWIIVAVVGGVLLLGPVIVPIFEPWSEINCRHQDINIKTGQARFTRMLWYVKVSERIEDTALSLALQGHSVDVADIEPWQRVNTFSPGLHHSPHYRFHGSIGQIRAMVMLSEMEELTPARMQEMAREILAAWQQSRTYRGADALVFGSPQDDAGDRAPVASQ